MEAHTRRLSFSHEMELRSIKRRGRPADTFADPVTRLRAWYWLGRVKAIAGVADAASLDRHRLAHGMDMAARHRFQSIEDDGFDPGRVMATQKQSLLDYVASKRGYRQTRRDYQHPLWHALQNRQWGHPKEASFITEELQKAGVALLEHKDADRADSLGIDWPDLFKQECLPPDASLGNPHDPLESYPCWSVPIVHPLDSLVDATRLTKLDGILALLLLYRRSLDTVALDQARDCRDVLKRAAEAFVSDWVDEPLDTWRYVIETRMLAWTPEFQPSAEDIRQAEQEIRQHFDEVADSGKKRGRSKLHPAKATSGKIARRWRRRTLMRACAKERWQMNLFAGFQALTPFNDWMISHRSLIDAHVDKASYLLVVGKGTDPETEAELLKDLRPLEIPVDDTHRIIRPYVSGYDEYRFGGCAFDLIPIRPKRI
ncbi:MAG: hypothetical protein ACYCZD_08545 [Rhodanobacter sp.]